MNFIISFDVSFEWLLLKKERRDEHQMMDNDSCSKAKFSNEFACWNDVTSLHSNISWMDPKHPELFQHNHVHMSRSRSIDSTICNKYTAIPEYGIE